MDEVIKMKDAVEYQSGAVVSKALVDRSGGNVTLFAFDVGQGLSEHTAPYDALVFVLDGRAEVTIAGKKLRLNEGEFTIMPANIPHSLKAVDKFKMLLVMVKT